MKKRVGFLVLGIVIAVTALVIFACGELEDQEWVFRNRSNIKIEFQVDGTPSRFILDRSADGIVPTEQKIISKRTTWRGVLKSVNLVDNPTYNYMWEELLEVSQADARTVMFDDNPYEDNPFRRSVKIAE